MQGNTMDQGNGGILRWMIGLLLAAGLGAAAFYGGRMGANMLCGGACAPLANLSAAVAEPFVWNGDKICWGMVIGLGIGLILWVALSVFPRQSGLAVISLAALGLLGALFPKNIAPIPAPVAEEVMEVLPEPEPEPEPEPIILPDPEPEPEPVEQEPINCPEANFWNGSGCMSCTTPESVPEAPSVFFSPLRFEAAWGYAKDNTFYHFADSSGKESTRINDLVIEGKVSAGGQAVCASQAILVVGSASSDGPLARNKARAKRRATRLAEHVVASCPNKPEIFAISLGQSRAEQDMPEDRALTIIALDTADGMKIDREMVERELGYALYGDSHGSELLSRYSAFPQTDWSWVRGGDGAINVAISPRPYVTIERLREGAPESCMSAQ